MIEFKYSPVSKEFPEGLIEIYTTINDGFFSDDELPLRILIKNLFGKTIREFNLHKDWFCNYNFLSYTTIKIITSTGIELSEWKWDTYQHGDYSHQLFYSWAKKNKNSNGIVIGTHDGTTGEWVRPVIEGLIKATLVEGGLKQFKELKNNYKNNSWINFENLVVSEDGSIKTFYEGGDGHTDSLISNITNHYVGSNNVKEKKIQTISINDLIKKSYINGDVKWMHLDTEGYDDILLYSIDENILPEIIICEILHFNEERTKNLISYFENKNYSVTLSGWNMICLK